MTTNKRKRGGQPGNSNAVTHGRARKVGPKHKVGKKAKKSAKKSPKKAPKKATATKKKAEKAKR
jgi:hypothetical protein